MNFFYKILSWLNLITLCLAMICGSFPGFTATELEYETAYGNPMKGFMPFYSEEGADASVPYSMEWLYIPMTELVAPDGTFTLRGTLEEKLEKIARRGHQAALRVYLDYPGKESAVPQFIWDMGVKKYEYAEYGGGVSPDYSDQRLIDFLLDFIDKFALNYDGDKRIAYITTGLIGHWGEWHVCSEIKSAMASNKQKRQIIHAFEYKFKHTNILTRYPGTPGSNNGQIGFHDDSFTYNTINSEKDYFFCNQLKKALKTNIWKTQPIGGEFRPEGQDNFLNGKVTEDFQDYDECVNKTHCSWLMMTGAFTGKLSDREIKTANEASAKLGYDFYVSTVQVNRLFDKAYVRVGVKNVGVAPIYASPSVFIGTEKEEIETRQDISKILPGKTEYFTAIIDIESGDRVHIRIDDVSKYGAFVRFSNVGGSTSSNGSFVLGTVK